MSHYLRRYVAGGTVFFTVITYRRQRIFANERARDILRESIAACRKDLPFTIDAFVLLSDHLHCIWTLPKNDRDYSNRWNRIKRTFTIRWRDVGGEESSVSPARHRQRYRGVWQPRFWDHAIRDEDDFANHVGYIHYNPVKHKLVDCPIDWEWSTFHRYVDEGVFDEHGCCQGRQREGFVARMNTMGARMGE